MFTYHVFVIEWMARSWSWWKCVRRGGFLALWLDRGLPLGFLAGGGGLQLVTWGVGSGRGSAFSLPWSSGGLSEE